MASHKSTDSLQSAPAGRHAADGDRPRSGGSTEMRPWRCWRCRVQSAFKNGARTAMSARQSRNQRSAAVSAGPAAAGSNGTKDWSVTASSGGCDALRLVLRTQSRSVTSSRLATISTDADTLAVCATNPAEAFPWNHEGLGNRKFFDFSKRQGCELLNTYRKGEAPLMHYWVLHKPQTNHEFGAGFKAAPCPRFR